MPTTRSLACLLRASASTRARRWPDCAGGTALGRTLFPSLRRGALRQDQLPITDREHWWVSRCLGKPAARSEAGTLRQPKLRSLKRPHRTAMPEKPHKRWIVRLSQETIPTCVPGRSPYNLARHPEAHASAAHFLSEAGDHLSSVGMGLDQPPRSATERGHVGFH